MFVFILILIWIAICVFWNVLVLNGFVAFLLGTATFIGLIVVLAVVISAADNGKAEKDGAKRISELERLKAERDKIPPEKQNFENPVYSDLSVRIAEIELKQRGIDLKPRGKFSTRWGDDDWLALFMTNDHWRDKF